jgi:hypothetical protein
MLKNGNLLRIVLEAPYHMLKSKKSKGFRIEEFGNSFRPKKKSSLMIKREHLSKSISFMAQGKLILNRSMIVKKVSI